MIFTERELRPRTRLPLFVLISRDRMGILLTPAAGAMLMSASTIIVAANAQLLRRLKL